MSRKSLAITIAVTVGAFYLVLIYIVLNANKDPRANLPQYHAVSSTWHSGAISMTAPVVNIPTATYRPNRYSYVGAAPTRTLYHTSPTAPVLHVYTSSSSHSPQQAGNAGGGANGGPAGTTTTLQSPMAGNTMLAMSTTSIPLAARELGGGVLADQVAPKFAPRRTNDSGLKPGYDPDDPFFTPVGDLSWDIMLILCLCAIATTALRLRRRRNSSINQ